MAVDGLAACAGGGPGGVLATDRPPSHVRRGGAGRVAGRSGRLLQRRGGRQRCRVLRAARPGRARTLSASGARGGGARLGHAGRLSRPGRSEEHTSELQSLMRISYAVFCLKKTKKQNK